MARIMLASSGAPSEAIVPRLGRSRGEVVRQDWPFPFGKAADSDERRRKELMLWAPSRPGPLRDRLGALRRPSSRIEAPPALGMQADVPAQVVPGEIGATWRNPVELSGNVAEAGPNLVGVIFPEADVGARPMLEGGFDRSWPGISQGSPGCGQAVGLRPSIRRHRPWATLRNFRSRRMAHIVKVASQSGRATSAQNDA